MRSALIWLRLDALMKTRIPTILGLGVLIIGVVAGVLLVGEGTGGFLPRADADKTPEQVRITNITDTSFSVSFTTRAPTMGLLEYGESAKNLEQKILDDRDQLSGESSLYRTHHITVTNLKPSTMYYFRIGTGGRRFFDNNKSPFTVRTSRPGLEPSEADSAQGKIRTPAASPANGSLIYITSPGASPLSAYAKQDGSWNIALSQMRTQDASAIFSIDSNTDLKIQVIGVDGESLDASIKYRQLNLLGELQFGQDVSQLLASDDFIEEDDLTQNEFDDEIVDDTLTDETDAPEGNVLDDLLSETDRFGTLPQSEITIIYPAKEDEIVSATQPEISGKAPPSSVLQIEVNSENTYYDVVETDAQGNWSWSPPDDLEPGSHSVTIRYTDENGVQQVETRTFLVQADSTYPSFVSTPSGELAEPSPTPTLTPSPTPTPTPTPVPTPVTVITPKPSPSLISYPATKAAQPVSASSGPFWLMGAGALFFSGLGIAWWVIKPARAEKKYGQPFS